MPEPHNQRVLQLLFTASHWHALAKLRMHTDYTLILLDDLTARLGQELRNFSQRTCSVFDTRELRREAAARARRASMQKMTVGFPCSMPFNLVT
jgi:hypothetical protein